MLRSKPMSERSNAGIVWMFFVLPIVTGVAILGSIVINVATHRREFTTKDWIWQVAWFGFLGLGLMTAAPAAGWQELQKRKADKRV